MNLYVSNLDFSSTERELEEIFSKYGAVSSAKVILDRATGRSRGFAFVEMPNDEEARNAISGLNGSAMNNRPLNVVEARPKENSGNNRRF